VSYAVAVKSNLPYRYCIGRGQRFLEMNISIMVNAVIQRRYVYNLHFFNAGLNA
jgi:hypothetical protein